jgi:hypothetical protein
MGPILPSEIDKERWMDGWMDGNTATLLFDGAK